MTQATRTLVTLAALLVVGGGVALYAWYGVAEKDRKESEHKDLDDRLFAATKVGEKNPDGGAAEAEFVQVKVTAKGDVTVLERAPGAPWRVVSPVQAPADKIAVDALVSQLQQSKFKHTIEETPDAEAVKKYGLDKPEFVVEAKAEVGAQKERRTVKLEAGVENTYDGSIYMRRNGESRVYAAEGGVKWALDKSTLELRDKDVLALDEAKVRSIEVKGRANEYVLTQDEKKNWLVAARRWAGMKAGAEASFEGDPTAITSALSALKQDKATAFPKDTPEARAAFEKPTLEANVELEGGKKVRLRLLQPQTDAGEKVRVLREEGADATLAEVSGTALAQLDRLPTDFRDKRLMPFKKEEVAKIVFTLAGGAQVIAVKAVPDGGADSWRITEPRQGPAKTFKIASVLWTMGTIKQQAVAEEDPKDPGKWGCDSRSRAISLYDAAGKALGHIEVCKDVPSAAGVSYMRGTRGDVVEAENSRLSDFPTKLEDLLEAPPADAGAQDAGT